MILKNVCSGPCRRIIPVVTLLAVVLLWKMPVILCGVLAVIAAVIIDNKKSLFVFIRSGIYGAGAEMIAIYFGVWNYTNPQFFGIPAWLPILWGIAALYIRSGKN